MLDEGVVEQSHIQHGLIHAEVAALGCVGRILEGESGQFVVSLGVLQLSFLLGVWWLGD